jgi:hypothetical protein
LKPTRSLCGAPKKSFVRGIVLIPQELRRATLVERDAKGDKWFGQVKCYNLW